MIEELVERYTVEGILFVLTFFGLGVLFVWLTATGHAKNKRAGYLLASAFFLVAIVPPLSIDLGLQEALMGVCAAAAGSPTAVAVSTAGAPSVSASLAVRFFCTDTELG